MSVRIFLSRVPYDDRAIDVFRIQNVTIDCVQESQNRADTLLVPARSFRRLVSSRPRCPIKTFRSRRTYSSVAASRSTRDTPRSWRPPEPTNVSPYPSTPCDETERRMPDPERTRTNVSVKPSRGPPIGTTYVLVRRAFVGTTERDERNVRKPVV